MNSKDPENLMLTQAENKREILRDLRDAITDSSWILAYPVWDNDEPLDKVDIAVSFAIHMISWYLKDFDGYEDDPGYIDLFAELQSLIGSKFLDEVTHDEYHHIGTYAELPF